MTEHVLHDDYDTSDVLIYRFTRRVLCLNNKFKLVLVVI